MELIRVMIIADDAFKSKEIADILSTDKRIQVITAVRNMEDGINKINKHQPEVIILNVQSPQTEDITLLENVMKRHPISVLMLYDEITKAAISAVQALSNGAVDLIRRPSEIHASQSIGVELINKIIAVTQMKINETMMKNEIVKQARDTPVSSCQPLDKTVIAIGTSTGGPRALEKVLSQMPNKLPAPVLIVQHMPAGFTKSLAERLNRLVDFPVKEAEDLEVIERNAAYIAPGDFHMKVKNRNRELVIELSKDAPIRGHRPSVDILLHSISEIYHINKIAIILTGMGRDGAEGIRKLKSDDPNAIVIAESEETAVIYGMPRAAVNTNCVDHELPLSQIGKALINIIRKEGGK